MRKYEGKPFVILGINSDRDRDQLKKVLEQEEITWRSWFDGGSTAGPIASKWNIQSWPTLFVLDHRGVIREKNPSHLDWDKLLEKLLQEQAADQKN